MKSFEHRVIHDKVPLSLTCVAFNGENIFVGTTSGCLLKYSTNDPKPKSLKDFGGKKAIQQLECVNNLLVSLVDGVISAHKVEGELELMAKINQRDSSMFCTDIISEKSFRIAIIKAKKLIIYQYVGDMFHEIKDYSLTDVPRTAVLLESTVCIGYRREYVLLSLSSGTQTTLFATGAKDAPPLVTKVMEKKVRTLLQSKVLVQAIPLGGCKAAATAKGSVAVITSNSVHLLSAISYENQLVDLLQRHQFDVALEVCRLLPEDDPKVRTVHLLYAHSLIASEQPEKAMEIFSQYNADPLSVIGVFPGLLPPHGVGREAFPPLELAGPQRDRAIKALSDFLRKDRGTLRTEGDAVRSARREALEEAEKTILETVKDGKCNITKAQETLQQLSTLGISVSGLNFGEGEESQVRDVFELLNDRADGLLDEQQRLPYAECTDPLVILDTTLLKCYITVSDMNSVRELLQGENFCNVNESAATLQKWQNFNLLVLLYRSKGEYAKALQLLADLKTGGPEELADVLKDVPCSESPLLFEYLEVLLRQQNEEGKKLALSVLTSPNHKDLSSDDVLTFLTRHCPPLRIAYLEHLTKQCENEQREMQETLIVLYLEELEKLRESTKQSEKSSEYRRPDQERKDIAEIRQSLLNFLTTSHAYRPEVVIKNFPRNDNDLLEEKAIVLARLDRIDEAIEIYVTKVGDISLAEECCLSREISKQPEAFLALVRAILKTENGTKKAIAIMEKHSGVVELSRVLPALPTTTPLADVSGCVVTALEEAARKHRETAVIANMCMSENLRIRESLLKLRSHSIHLDEGSICPVCGKPLRQSAVAYLPGDDYGTPEQVMHYMCLQRLQQSDAKQ